MVSWVGNDKKFFRHKEFITADEVIGVSKYDYLSKHKDYLYLPEDLENEKDVLKENIEIKKHDGAVIGYKKYQEYDGVTVGIVENTEHHIDTIFPDEKQRKVENSDEWSR